MEKNNITELKNEELNAIVGGKDNSADYAKLCNYLKERGLWNRNINETLDGICQNHEELKNLDYNYVKEDDGRIHFEVYDKERKQMTYCDPATLLHNLQNMHI